MVGHQLAPELQLVLAGGLGELVDEALHEDAVLVDVHAAPHARGHVRVAHGVVDQQVRDRVLQRVLPAEQVRRGHALEHERIAPLVLLDHLWQRGSEDRLARQPHVQGDEVVVGVEAARQLALHDRVVAALAHVLLARPEQLDRHAGHLLGDQHRLARPVLVQAAAPAVAAAEVDLVDLALVGRQAGGGQHRRERGLAVLRRRPHLALIGRVARGAVHRLHGGVVLVRVGVDRLHLLHRAGQRRLGVARLVADEGLLGAEPLLQHLGDGGAGDVGVGALVPDDRQRIERRLGLPPGIGHHRHRGVSRPAGRGARPSCP